MASTIVSGLSTIAHDTKPCPWNSRMPPPSGTARSQAVDVHGRSSGERSKNRRLAAQCLGQLAVPATRIIRAALA